MKTTAIKTAWAVCAFPLALGKGEVHVWHFPLTLPAGSETDWRKVLAPSEREQAGKFAFPHLRERYIAAHATMRRLLGGYLHAEPASLVFEISSRGKPFLAGHPLHFNLSHTEDQGLLAVTRVGEVGVDIERLNRKLDRPGIAQRFFSKAEAAALASLPEAQQAEGFCNLWTRKEAWLKATGVGISEGLHKVEFNCQPGEPARLLRIDGDESAAAGWLVQSFRPPGECVGALVLRAATANVHYFQLQPTPRPLPPI